jgi:hypothetical protein
MLYLSTGSASRSPRCWINAMRHVGDFLKMFGDFPTLKDPRQAEAYSPSGTPSRPVDTQGGRGTD